MVCRRLENVNKSVPFLCDPCWLYAVICSAMSNRLEEFGVVVVHNKQIIDEQIFMDSSKIFNPLRIILPCPACAKRAGDRKVIFSVALKIFKKF